MISGPSMMWLAVTFIAAVALYPGYVAGLEKTGPGRLRPPGFGSVSPSDLVRSGARVRITLKGESADRIEGRIETMDADSLDLLTGQALRIMTPWGDISRLEVQREERPVVKLALLGGMVGLALGTQIDASGNIYEPAETGGLIGLPIGMLAGGLIGSRFRSHRWVKVPIEDLRVSLPAGP